jgi:hypothetical protein
MGPMPRLLASVRAVLAAAVVLAAGCGGGSAASGHSAATGAGCSGAFQERLDPLSTRHLFPGAPVPTYLSYPPTSGPHELGPPATGAVTTPIPVPRQVAMLESGYVIVQYRDLPAAEVSALAPLAGTLVTVAPAAGALPNRVVATAWTWKEVCGSAGPAELAALRSFISARRGKGFNQHV